MHLAHLCLLHVPLCRWHRRESTELKETLAIKGTDAFRSWASVGLSPAVLLLLDHEL